MHLVINGDKMSIHLYSDSFGECTWEKGHWPFELAKMQKQKLLSNGAGGTGPNWSLKKLIRDYESNKIRKFDTVIVLLSDQKRMEFPWLEHEGVSADGMFLLAEEIRKDSQLHIQLKGGEITKDSSDEEIQEHFNLLHPLFNNIVQVVIYDKTRFFKHENEIKTVANTLGPMFLYENVKNITFLHLLSKQNKKIKFLVFTCFSLNHYTSKCKNFNIESTGLLDKLDFENLNSPNFYYVRTPISFMVGIIRTKAALYNHMTEKQNINFAKFCNDILNNDDPDTSWFAYEYYDDPFAEDFGDEPPPPTFIYE